jgi:hypothetical protein
MDATCTASAIKCLVRFKPTQDGLRLNHLHRIKKTRPKPRNPAEQRTITAKQSEPRWCPSQSDGQLMAEKQILSLKPAPRLWWLSTRSIG